MHQEVVADGLNKWRDGMDFKWRVEGSGGCGWEGRMDAVDGVVDGWEWRKEGWMGPEWKGMDARPTPGPDGPLTREDAIRPKRRVRRLRRRGWAVWQAVSAAGPDSPSFASPRRTWWS